MGSTAKKILLVEDEAIIALAESRAIAGYGYEVVCANTGETAVELAKADEGIDLVLMDIDLGHGIDGLEAARLILGARDIPIVFLSSQAGRPYAESLKGVSHYGCVIKNSCHPTLQSSIERAFELFEERRGKRGEFPPRRRRRNPSPG